ncbi:hypothetical protein [Leucobacter sp. M11]|uniref:hypothetical protein n=1 Tax=Leucobacter sp. M11 TaxID=2993565 RepID=UPI002D7E27CC|nr:hypothetical protein [Leucobacter sp. M11]MEB4613821.1 hypothetical protein [Leucobacter sp. M11]
MTIITPNHTPGSGSDGAPGPRPGPAQEWQIVDDRPERRSPLPQILTGLGILLIVVASFGATHLIMTGSGFFGVLGLIGLGVLWVALVIASIVTTLRFRAFRRAQMLLTAAGVILNPLTVFILSGILITLF